MKPTPRMAVTGVFASFGIISGIWSGSIPSIVRGIGIDQTELGLLFTLLMISDVLAMSIGGWLARRFSNRAIMLVTVPAMGIAAALLHASASRMVFVPALLGFGVSQGLTDLCMNGEGTAIEAELGRPILTTMHGVLSLCMGLLALAGSLIAVRSGPSASAPLLLATGVLATILVWFAIPSRRVTLAAASSPARRSWVLAPLILLGLAIGFENSGEVAGFYWSAKLLDEAAPALAAIAGIGPAFFCGCAAIARLNGDRIRHLFGDRNVVVGSLVIAAIGFVGVGLFDDFASRVASFAVVGLGTACVFPCLFAIAARSDPSARTQRLGFISMIAGGPRVVCKRCSAPT